MEYVELKVEGGRGKWEEGESDEHIGLDPSAVTKGV
jgi:hypothetical protein